MGKQTPLLHWLPDECFYSLCSRQHVFMGNQSPGQTLNLLFGDSAKSFAHDLPYNLSMLNERAKSAWGDPEEIICQHTISPIFFPFQSLEHVHDLKQALQGPQLSSLKYRLGLITGRFGGEHPLKACLECMSTDRFTFGATYWHLSHQIPGVTTCSKHGSLLMESLENRPWSRGYQWLLPDERSLAASNQSAISPTAVSALQTMSDSAIALFKMGTTTHFDPMTVAHVYRDAISKLGASRNAREATADCFAQRCSELHACRPFTALSCSRRWAIGFISQMTRKPRGYCHPLKHLTLIWWLFGRLETFRDAYKQYANDLQNSDKDSSSQLVPVQDNNERAAIVERETGASRPKKILNDIKEMILNSVISGVSKKEVCSRFGVSISSVNRLLRLNPAHNQQITSNNFHSICEKKRAAWRSVVNQNPSASANTIKKHIPNIYAWLYRNDRPWLMLETKSCPSGRSGNHVTIDWEARDEQLLELIKKSMATPSADLKKFRKRDLYQMVPNLFSSLEQKSHYPKTRQFISELCK